MFFNGICSNLSDLSVVELHFIAVEVTEWANRYEITSSQPASHVSRGWGGGEGDGTVLVRIVTILVIG